MELLRNGATHQNGEIIPVLGAWKGAHETSGAGVTGGRDRSFAGEGCRRPDFHRFRGRRVGASGLASHISVAGLDPATVAGRYRAGGGDYIRSMIVAMPCPPPMHIVISA
jgi:hypothetical protein